MPNANSPITIAASITIGFASTALSTDPTSGESPVRLTSVARGSGRPGSSTGRITGKPRGGGRTSSRRFRGGSPPAALQKNRPSKTVIIGITIGRLARYQHIVTSTGSRDHLHYGRKTLRLPRSARLRLVPVRRPGDRLAHARVGLDVLE